MTQMRQIYAKKNDELMNLCEKKSFFCRNSHNLHYFCSDISNKNELMRAIKITIDKSLPKKSALSSIHGVKGSDFSIETDKKEYIQIRDAFLNNSKRSMAQQISKYLS